MIKAIGLNSVEDERRDDFVEKVCLCFNLLYIDLESVL